MAEDAGEIKAHAEETEAQPPAEDPPPHVLSEDDGCGEGFYNLDGSRLTPEPEGQPRVIYVEFAQPFDPDTLLVTPEAKGAEGASAVEHAGLRSFLHARGFLRAEHSLLPTSQKLSDRMVRSRARFHTLYFSPGTDVESVTEALNDRLEVVHAIPTRRLVPPSTLLSGPLDEPLARPHRGSMVISDPKSLLDNQWYLFRCRVDGAWAQGVSGQGVIIADIDWGFLTTHQDLKPRIKFQRNMVRDNCDVTQGSAICHGTATLGIAGAANNGRGMVGVAFGADLWALQAGEDRYGSLDPAPWCEAIALVCEQGGGGLRKVIMLEVQTEYGENIEVIPAIRESIKKAIASGVVVCVAAGNGCRDAGVDVKLKPFPLSGSILVGATKYDDHENPLGTSNFGPRVTVYAPGDERHDLTCSSRIEHGYRNYFGRTSGATPKVAGTVALMLEANPTLTHCEIKDILRETGAPIKTDNPNAAGIFLNAERAVLEARRHAC